MLFGKMFWKRKQKRIWKIKRKEKKKGEALKTSQAHSFLPSSPAALASFPRGPASDRPRWGAPPPYLLPGPLTPGPHRQRCPLPPDGFDPNSAGTRSIP